MRLYYYTAIVRSIYDGDTLRADIDLGFDIWMFNQQIRLFGLNTPELREPERALGLAARQFVVDRIPPGSEIKILTIKDSKEKYGRYLATIFYSDNLINLNDELLLNGHAKVYQ